MFSLSTSIILFNLRTSIITPAFEGVAEEKHDVPAALIVTGMFNSLHFFIAKESSWVLAGRTIWLARYLFLNL